MTELSIPANCTCGRLTESPAMHAGTCAVWSLHHHLTDVHPVEILNDGKPFGLCLHVGLKHPSNETDHPAIAHRIRRGARQWALANGYDISDDIGGGLLIGPVETETRMIFCISKK